MEVSLGPSHVYAASCSPSPAQETQGLYRVACECSHGRSEGDCKPSTSADIERQCVHPRSTPTSCLSHLLGDLLVSLNRIWSHGASAASDHRPSGAQQLTHLVGVLGVASETLILSCNDVKCDMALKCQACHLTCEPVNRCWAAWGEGLSCSGGLRISVVPVGGAWLCPERWGIPEKQGPPCALPGVQASHVGPASLVCVDEEK